MALLLLGYCKYDTKTPNENNFNFGYDYGEINQKAPDDKILLILNINK